MTDGVGELIANVIIGIGYLLQACLEIGGAVSSSNNNNNSSTTRKTRSFGQLSATESPRAVLTTVSQFKFGNDCERLVNIAFQTSQSFPSIMGTYADVIDYLRKELAKQYPDDYFHIIIGENQKFSFSVDDSQHYAEIEQERYRVLIFSTKQKPNIKLDTHDAESQTKFKWN